MQPTFRRAWGLHRRLALGYCVVLAGVAALNYVPGVPRPDGAVFGIFALDAYDDALHLASALWAGAAAAISARAARLPRRIPSTSMSAAGCVSGAGSWA